MQGDVRVLDLGDELWLDTERPALQALFDMIRRFKIGFDVELHKRTLECALLSLVGPRAREVAGAQELPSAEHSRCAPAAATPSVVLVATADGVDVICAADDAPAVRAALVDAGAVRGRRAGRRAGARRGRPPPLRPRASTTRRSPRRPGSTSAPSASPRAATSARRRSRGCSTRASPTATCAACACRARGRPPATRCAWASARSGRLGTVVVSPALGPIALALVRREAEPGTTLDVGDDGLTATVVELPFA